MDDLRRLEAKIDKLDERLDRIDIVLTQNTGSLIEHIRRTNIIEDSMRPIQKHVYYMEGALKLVGIVALVAGILRAFHLV